MKDEEESGSRYDEMLAEQKNLIDLGKSVEVINGALSNHAGSNGLSVEETRRIMEELTNYAVSKGKVWRRYRMGKFALMLKKSRKQEMH